jgi:hypothetical protein
VEDENPTQEFLTKRKKEKIESRHETLKCTEWYLVVNSRNDKRVQRREEKARKGMCRKW